MTLHKQWSFPLRISSVNADESAVPVDFVTFTEGIVNGKLHFLCSAVRQSKAFHEQGWTVFSSKPC